MKSRSVWEEIKGSLFLAGIGAVAECRFCADAASL